MNKLPFFNILAKDGYQSSSSPYFERIRKMRYLVLAGAPFILTLSAAAIAASLSVDTEETTSITVVRSVAVAPTGSTSTQTAMFAPTAAPMPASVNSLSPATTASTLNSAGAQVLNTNWKSLVGVERVGVGLYRATKTAEDLKPGGTIQTHLIDIVAGGKVSTFYSSAPSGVDTLELVIRPDATRIVWGPFAGKSGPTKNIILRAEDGGELIFATTTSQSAPIWLQESDGSWSTNVPGTSRNSPPTDWNPSMRAGQADGMGTAFKEVASRAALTPGTYFRNSAVSLRVYVKPFAGRAIDKWIIPSTTLAPALPVSAKVGNFTLWADNVTLVGGQALFGRNEMFGIRPTIILNRSRAIAGLGAGGINNFAVQGAYDVYLFNCVTALAYADAFGFHGNRFGSPNVMLIAPRSFRASGNPVGVQRDNVLTSHEMGYLGVIMPTIDVGSYGGVAGAIDTAHMDIFGGRIANSRATDPAWQWTIHAGNGAKVRLYEVTVQESNGAITMLQDGATSTLEIYGMARPAKVKGTVTVRPIA